MTVRALVLLVSLAIAVGATAQDVAACQLKEIKVEASSATVGASTVRLAAPDDAQAPQAWLGPLQISTAGHTCSVDAAVSIIERPILTDGAGHLWVSTYSGSTVDLYAIDMGTCSILWHSGDMTGPVTFKHDAVSIGGKALALRERCLPASAAAPAN